MVEVVQGDIFASGAQTLVNTVNTVGVMGKGIALEFRERFPAMHRDYVERCSHDERGICVYFTGGFLTFTGNVSPWRHHWFLRS